jgi:hypothetical protein
VRTARDARLVDHVVVGDRVGWIHIDRQDRITLVTHAQPCPLDPDTPIRATMGRDKAEAQLKLMIAADGPATPEPLLLDELALDLGLTRRMVCLILRRRDGSIEPPESPLGVPDHDYMGAFDAGDSLVLADRCYVAETRPILANATPATPGRWHAFIRHEPLYSDRSVALLVVHEEHLDDATLEGTRLGSFGVDSGSAVIVDGRARHRAELFVAERDWQEGLFDGVGCFSWTTDGDGVFDSRVHLRDGRATMLRASLGDPQYAFYRPPKPPPSAAEQRRFQQALDTAGAARDYSPRVRFAVGDRLRHPTFGDGVVRELLADRKIAVAFGDGPRTLVHGR